LTYVTKFGTITLMGEGRISRGQSRAHTDGSGALWEEGRMMPTGRIICRVLTCDLGPKRGRCNCGECECNENYAGRACHCLMSNDTCMAENGVSRLFYFIIRTYRAQHFPLQCFDTVGWATGMASGL